MREGDPGQLEESGLYRPLSGGCSDPFALFFFPLNNPSQFQFCKRAVAGAASAGGGKQAPCPGAGDLRKGSGKESPIQATPFFSQPFLSFYLALVTPSRLPPSHPQGWALPAGIYSLRWRRRASSHGDCFPGSREVRRRPWAINASMQSPLQPSDPARTSQPLGQPRAWGSGEGVGGGQRKAYGMGRGNGWERKGERKMYP